MKFTKLSLLALVLIVAALWSGCKNSAPDAPAPGLGSVTVTKYVSIGNSLTAGYQSNALYASAQAYSYPNLISQQLNRSGASLGSFEQPLWGDPGSPDASGKAARYELISWNGPVIGPRGLAAGSPTNSALARPYDNLGVPGAVIYDFLDTTNFSTKAVARKNPFFAAVLRSNAGFGANILAQAVKLKPDLVTFWLGNNDVLGYATSGGFSPNAPTATATFAFLYNSSLQNLRAALPNAKIVVANIPNVTAIPFFTTVGPKIAASLPAGVKLAYQKHGETGVASGSSTLTEATPPLVCLTGSPYASLLGKATGAWYIANGYPGLPAGIDTTKPFGLHPQNPWPDALILDVDEQNAAATSVQAFNSIIAAAANANNAALVDINAFFTTVKTQGYHTPGQTFTADYISGELFSFDGVHPSSKGAGVMANLFIDKMNSAFGTNIIKVDVTTIPGLPVPLNKSGEKISPVIPQGAFDDLKMLWGE